MHEYREKIDASQLDLKDTVVAINRVTKVVKGGKNLSFSALVVVGDGHGHVGYGVGKAKEVPSAIRKGLEAAKKNLTTLEVLHRLCDEEKKSRLDSAIKRRIQDARFPQINTVDGFDFDFDSSRKKLKARYLALHDLGFLAKGINPLFIGNPGTGKTFLSRSLA